MILQADDEGQGPAFETPGAMLDALRDHPEWDEPRREAWFDHLIARFPPEELIAAARRRLGDLGGDDAEAVLRLIEAFGAPEVFQELAAALVAQPGLPPERAWEALSLLEATGLIEESPELAERWEELNEVIDDEGSLAALAEQLEEDPDGPWVPLQALGGIEPEMRGPIIAGLGGQPTGPGLIEFLRLLAYT
ncbi:MAG: hypothetical protein IRY99_03740, partial [Isosphaeraceae bacterium]|nr:hypothetical protein [Isosphaeraceae bacterium]